MLHVKEMEYDYFMERVYNQIKISEIIEVNIACLNIFIILFQFYEFFLSLLSPTPFIVSALYDAYLKF